MAASDSVVLFVYWRLKYTKYSILFYLTKKALYITTWACVALLNFMPGNVGKTNQKLSVELSTIKYVNCKTLKIYKWTEFYPGLFACKPGQHNFSLYKICNRGFLLALPGGLRQNCTDAVWFNPLFLSLFLLWPRKGLSVCLLRPVSHKRLEAPPPLVYPLCGGWGGGGRRTDPGKTQVFYYPQ